MSKRNISEDNLFKSHLRAQNKLEYVQRKNRPDIDCILCGIIEDSPKVEKYKIFQDNIAVISLNLYPYNLAHLLIFPIRHITDYREFTEEEIIHISNLIKRSEDLIQDLYNPTGFNLGLNQGEHSGASIRHLHFHLVPRFHNELGYIDIIGQTRIVVESVEKVYQKIKEIAPKYYQNIKI